MMDCSFHVCELQSKGRLKIDGCYSIFSMSHDLVEKSKIAVEPDIPGGDSEPIFCSSNMLFYKKSDFLLV